MALTARQRLLSLHGARVFELDVLSSEHGLGLLSALVGEQLCEAEAEAAQRIVSLCGGLPLALAIAGARIASRPKWSLQWFADQLSDERHRLDLLQVGNRAVRSAFALSFRHLPDELQETFRTLGLWTGPDLTSWIIAALAGENAIETERRLEQLVDAQLLGTLEHDEAGSARYRLHDLLHDYASELAHNESSIAARWAALERVAGVYAAAVDGTVDLTVYGSLAGAVGASRSRDAWLMRERIGIERALDIAIARGMHRELVTLALARAATVSWPAEWQKWRAHLEQAIQAAEHVADDSALVAVLTEYGRLLREVGHFQAAGQALRRAVHIDTDDERRASARQCLGDTYRFVGRLDEALGCFRAILGQLSASDVSYARAQALEGYGDAARGLSRWAESTRHLTQATAIYGDLDDFLARGGALCRLAMVFRDQARHDEARNALVDALGIVEGLDARWSANIRRQLGIVERNEGQFAQAWPYFEQSRDVFLALVDLRGVALTDRNFGDQLRASGDHDQALERLTAALSQFEMIEDVRWAARAHLSLADTHRLLADWSVARSHQRAAAETFDSIADRPAQARAWRSLALIERDAGNSAASECAFESAVGMFQSLDDVLWTSKCLASWSRVPTPKGRTKDELVQAAASVLAIPEERIPIAWSTVWREW